MVENYLTGPENVLKTISNLEAYRYRQNTLGYLTKQIDEASDGSLSAIKPINVDGQPQYIFTTQSDVLPTTALFQPLIVSPERYEELKAQGKTEGYIAIDVEVPNTLSSKGIDATDLTYFERDLYGAKIPFAEIFGGFSYPIESIELYGIIGNEIYDSYTYSSSEFNVSVGNLYFDESFAKKIPMGTIYRGIPFEDSQASEIRYYKLVIKIEKIIPSDGSKELMRRAFSIATTYSIMDYFDQYTYAQVTAQMIADIGYTEIMTITSTAISAPVLVLGSYAVKALQEGAKAATSVLVKEIMQKVIIGTIKETVEEIVINGFFETAIQSAVRMTGGNDDAGHWLSTLFTSLRETANFGFLTGGGSQNLQGFAGQVQTAMGLSQDFQSTVSTLGVFNEEMNLEQIAIANEEFLTAQMAELGILGSTLQDSKISLGRILGTGILAGLSLVAPSMAGFNIYAISKLIGGISSKFSAKLQNKQLVQRNAMMLLINQEITQKQKTELGKTPEAKNIESLRKAPIVSKNPKNPDPLSESTYVEEIVSPVIYGSSYGRMNTLQISAERDYESRTTWAQIEAVRALGERERTEQNLENAEELQNGYDAKGEFAEIIEKIKESGKFKEGQLTKIQKALEKLKGEYYDEKTILDSSTEGLDGAINLHISRAIEEKILKGDTLTQLEYGIFNVISMLSGDTGIINKKGVSVKYPPYFLRGKWDKTKSSPYAPIYHIFMEMFIAFSIQNDIVKDQAELHNVLLMSGHSLEGKLRNLLGITEKGEKTESVFKIDEDVLNRWYVRIRNSIESKFPNTKATLYGELDEIFDPLFRAFGYEYHHPLYRSAKLMLAEIGDILVDAKVIESNSITNINKLIKGSRAFSVYNNLKKNPQSVPKVNPSEELLK